MNNRCIRFFLVGMMFFALGHGCTRKAATGEAPGEAAGKTVGIKVGITFFMQDRVTRLQNKLNREKLTAMLEEALSDKEFIRGCRLGGDDVAKFKTVADFSDWDGHLTFGPWVIEEVSENYYEMNATLLAGEDFSQILYINFQAGDRYVVKGCYIEYND